MSDEAKVSDEALNIPKWYVVHTYSGYENKVAETIKKVVENRSLHSLITDVMIPTELVQEKRLSQAAWLLRNTDKRVDEIANSVGYENISYFHRIFADRFGQSPRKFRVGSYSLN